MAIIKKTVPINDSAFAKTDHTTIWWLGGGGFLINARGVIIMVDPVISVQPDNNNMCETGLPLIINYPLGIKDIKNVDAILYTHSDDDHLGPISAPAIAARLHPRNYGPPPVFEKLTRLGVHHTEIVSCRYGDILEQNNVFIEVIDADHPYGLISITFGDTGLPRPFRPGDCCGYILRTSDANLLFPGDTRLMEFHLKLKDIHMAALDVSLCPYHLNTTGAFVLAETLVDSLLYPYHYGTYDEPDNPAFNGNPDILLSMITHPDRVRVYPPGQPLSFKSGKEMK